MRLDVKLEVEAVELIDWTEGEGKIIRKLL
jgi:hypothetical protein